MQLRFSDEDEAFRREFADWLAEHLRGEFDGIRGRGGPGDAATGWRDGGFFAMLRKPSSDG